MGTFLTYSHYQKKHREYIPWGSIFRNDEPGPLFNKIDIFVKLLWQKKDFERL